MIVYTTASSGGGEAHRIIAEWATAEDHVQAQSRQLETKKHDFLLARSAVRALLYKETERRDWHIVPDHNGKPLAQSPKGKPTPHISLAHTKGLIACAVSHEEPIGIDAEYWRPRDFKALANYAFTPEEQEQVANDGMPAFYRIWTLKEAMAKESGKGILTTLHENICITKEQMDGFMEFSPWQLYYAIHQPNYSLAIAIKRQEPWLKSPLSYVRIENQH